MPIELRHLIPLLISFLIGFFADISCINSTYINQNPQGATILPASKQNAWNKPTPRTNISISAHLSSPRSSQNIAGAISNNRNKNSPSRDYVAPINPGLDYASAISSKSRPNNMRDYVSTSNPFFNQVKTQQPSQGLNFASALGSKQANYIRDYVSSPNPFINRVTTERSFINNNRNMNIPPVNSLGISNSATSNNHEMLSEDDELREFSEELIKKDVNNAYKYIRINYQGRTSSSSSRDEASLPLLTIDQEVYKIPSIEKLMLLHNNYFLRSHENEVYTGQEKIEENNFLDVILATPVMQHTRNFLIKKGKIAKDPKDFKNLLREIWFNMYSRGGGKIGSSGFEHVFLAEIKNDGVIGLHNWLYFNAEEVKQTANYLGYMKTFEFEKGAIVKHHFNFYEKDKPVDTMFIGTSPEFEMALYSICFIVRPDNVCPLRLAGKNFIIRTFTYRYRGKNMVGSAFPEI